MKGVPRGDTIHRGDEVSSGTHVGHIEAQSFIDNGVQALERGVNGIGPLNRRIPMEYLLVDPNVGYESLPLPTA